MPSIAGMGDTLKRWCWLAGLLLAAIAAPAAAVEFPNKPPRSDYFVDSAQLLDSASRAEINRIAGALLKEQKIPLYVVTIASLSSYDASGLGIEGYATELFNHWGIGARNRNYGILLLVSLGDRKARIELGGAYGHDYDAQTRDIMQSLIVPGFRREAYGTGVVDGVRGLDAMARGLALPKPTAPWWSLPLFIGLCVLMIFMIYNLFKTGRSGWAWALIALLAGFLFFALRNAGSSGGFGGGSSGGGGATGSW